MTVTLNVATATQKQILNVQWKIFSERLTVCVPAAAEPTVLRSAQRNGQKKMSFIQILQPVCRNKSVSPQSHEAFVRVSGQEKTFQSWKNLTSRSRDALEGLWDQTPGSLLFTSISFIFLPLLSFLFLPLTVSAQLTMSTLCSNNTAEKL